MFSSLEPLTHSSLENSTSANEEYMVLLGEFGNTNNIETYEFELYTDDIQFDKQIIKLIPDATSNDKFHYVNNKDWVIKYKDQRLSFSNLPWNDPTTKKIDNLSPISGIDTDYNISDLNELPNIYQNLGQLSNLDGYDMTRSYKENDLIRVGGKLYRVIGSIPSYELSGLTVEAAWQLAIEKTQEVPEQYLPNIYVNDYKGQGWQILQTVDNNLSIEECCPGPDDNSYARITTTTPHGLNVGDEIFIVNASTGISSVNGQWTVSKLEDPRLVGNNEYKSMAFFIPTRITDKIYTGKVFVFRKARFSSALELTNYFGLNDDGTVNNNAQEHPIWTPKFNPVSNVIGDTNISPPATAGGFPSAVPLAVVYNDNGYSIYRVDVVDGITNLNLIKQDQKPVSAEGIEHFIIYDHSSGKTTGKIELFDPKTVLDLGCGTGKALDYFLSKHIEVIGVEGSKIAISIANHPELIIKYNLENELNNLANETSSAPIHNNFESGLFGIKSNFDDSASPKSLK